MSEPFAGVEQRDGASVDDRCRAEHEEDHPPPGNEGIRGLIPFGLLPIDIKNERETQRFEKNAGFSTV